MNIEMNDAIYTAACKAADLYLSTMPDDFAKQFKSDSLHVKLAKFFSWCVMMGQMDNAGEFNESIQH